MGGEDVERLWDGVWRDPDGDPFAERLRRAWCGTTRSGGRLRAPNSRRTSARGRRLGDDMLAFARHVHQRLRSRDDVCVPGRWRPRRSRNLALRDKEKEGQKNAAAAEKLVRERRRAFETRPGRRLRRTPSWRENAIAIYQHLCDSFKRGGRLRCSAIAGKTGPPVASAEFWLARVSRPAPPVVRPEPSGNLSSSGEPMAQHAEIRTCRLPLFDRVRGQRQRSSSARLGMQESSRT